MLRGELGIVIDKIELKRFGDTDSYDMCIKDKDGGFLHIVGDNNLPEIFEEALKNIFEYNIKINI